MILVRAGRWLLLAALPVILAATLLPIGGAQEAPGFPCLICGQRGTADALLNIILFAPLGAGLRLRGFSAGRSCLLALLLSALIELAQMALPGRDANLADVLFNTAGAMAGVWIAGTMGRPAGTAPHAPARVWLTATAAAGVWLATGYLLAPAPPPEPYMVQWTPNLDADQWYRGRVLGAALGPLELRPGRPLDGESVRALLLGGAPLTAQLVAGPPSGYIAPWVRIRGAGQQDLVSVGSDGDDFVLQYSTRAGALRLDQPDLRIPEALRDVSPGDTIALTARRGAKGFAVALNDAEPRLLGATVGHGWGLLLYVEEFPPWLKTALSAAWIAGWMLLVAVWAAPRTTLAAAGGALFVVLWLVPPLTNLLPTPPLEFLAALAGFAAGRVARRATPRAAPVAALQHPPLGR